MPTYAVTSRFASKFPNAVTLVDGVPVALSGKDITITKPGTATHPPSTRIVKGATQAQLKHLKEVDNHPDIEILPDPSK